MQIRGLNKFTEKCPSFIVVCEEDAMLIGRSEPDQKYASIDIGIAVAHLCYAATQQGLSTCIMGAFDPEALLKVLGITEPKRVRLVIAVGYAAVSYTHLFASVHHELFEKSSIKNFCFSF